MNFCGHDFECVDKGFGENKPVDVVVRPEDLYIFPVSDAAQLRGVVQSCIFKGVHYEMTVLCGNYELVVQDYHAFEAGTEVGMLVKPFDIHIMKKERTENTFEATIVDETHVEFLGCRFECLPLKNCPAEGTKAQVAVGFDRVVLLDNEEDGMLTGEVKFILYKGDHYHLTVLSDWEEDVFVDTNDVWDDGDRVANLFLFTQELDFALSDLFSGVCHHSADSDPGLCLYRRCRPSDSGELPEVLCPSRGCQHVCLFHWYRHPDNHRLYPAGLSGSLDTQPEQNELFADADPAVYPSHVGKHPDPYAGYRGSV